MENRLIALSRSEQASFLELFSQLLNIIKHLDLLFMAFFDSSNQFLTSLFMFSIYSLRRCTWKRLSNLRSLWGTKNASTSCEDTLRVVMGILCSFSFLLWKIFGLLKRSGSTPSLQELLYVVWVLFVVIDHRSDHLMIFQRSDIFDLLGVHVFLLILFISELQ